MKKPTTFIVMFAYLIWGLNSAVNASVTTLERWRTNMTFQPDKSVLEREIRGSEHINRASAKPGSNRYPPKSSSA